MKSIINLTVHGIGSTTRELDPGEENVWISVDQFEQLLDAIADRPDVRLTFDDGNASDVEIALPLLRARGMSAEFFLCAGLIGDPGRVSADQVRELVSAGMPIGSHGWGHIDWRGLDPRRIVSEFERSRQVLRRLTGRQIEHVSVPFGSYDRRVLRELRRVGVGRAFTSDGGHAAPDAWLQDRISLHQDMDVAWLESVLAPQPLARRLRAVAARSAKRSRGALALRPADPLRVATPKPDRFKGRLPRVAVVIVSYNSAEVLGNCLASLPAGAQGVDLVEVVVVDNASRDDSVTVAEAFGEVPTRAIKSGVNAGYAAGINLAIDTLPIEDLDAVLILNPDCMLRPGALAAMAAVLAKPGCGIVAPKLIEPDGRLQPSLRHAPSIHRSLAEALLGSAAGRIGLGELVTAPSAYRAPGVWSWATGAAMLISTAVVADLGPWDESFLLYSEETDYALRAADCGWDLWYEPSAVIAHVGGEAHTNPMLASLVVTNRVELFRRRRGPIAGVAFYLVELLGLGVRAAAGRDEARAQLTALVRPSTRITVLPGGSQ